MWKRWHEGFGWPFTGAWAEQPAHIYEIVVGFESMYHEWKEHQKREERTQRNPPSRAAPATRRRQPRRSTAPRRVVIRRK